MIINKANWKKRLGQALWLLAGIGTVVLLGAAMQKKDRKKCTDIKIEITGVEQQMFIDEKDITEILKRGGQVIGEPIVSLNLRYLETLIEKDPWVKNAEMFFDNKQVLEVKIEERQPVARVFTIQGSSFYLDSGGMRLPLSEKLSARVPVFTSYPSERSRLSKPDSALLKNVVNLGQYILADSFWMAQVAQVDITPQAGFELVPVIGNHTVALGHATDIDSKFKRLYTFYKQAWLQNGINTYSKLDVQYRNQVVATKKGYEQQAMTKDSIPAKIEASPPAAVHPVTPPPAAIVKQAPKTTDKTKSVNKTNNKTNNNSLTKKRSMKRNIQTAPKAKAVMKKQANNN